MKARVGTVVGFQALAALAMLSSLSSGCGSADVKVASPSPSASAAPTAVAPPPPGDVLGAHPVPVSTAPWQPPAPVVYQTANGMTVWLLERHTLPVVAVSVAIPTGASSDPKGKAGLAEASAGMLDEGAGKLGALEFAKAVDQIGAHLGAGASYDATSVSLGVVKRNFAEGMHLLGDAVVHPRFDEKEWKRVHDLWMNELKQRGTDPDEVARVVEAVTVFGADHPYGHPVEGFLASAPKVQLADAKKFYAEAWRPDRAMVVVVGDVTRAELDAQLDAAFGGWKKPAGAPLPIVTPAAPPDATPDVKSPGPTAKAKVVLVDRPDATQSVVVVARPGLAISDPRVPALRRANIALGGSFTSRLNADLREAHGWSYGARSSVSARRGVGTVGAASSVILDKTVDALKAMLADIDDFSHTGLTEEEADKTRVVARNHVVEAYETVEHASHALAGDAALGLGPDFEAKASVASDSADRRELNKLASIFYDRARATIILVGPRATLEGPLAAAGFTSIDLRDAEGNPIAGAAPPKAKAKASAEAKPDPKTGIKPEPKK